MNKYASSLMVAAALLTGCKSTLTTPVVTELPGYVTNIVVTALPGGGWATNYNVSQAYQTNYVINPNVKIIGESVGVVPVYGTAAAAAIGLLSSLYLAWLNKKNKSIASSTMQGVEAFRDELRLSGEKGEALDKKLVAHLMEIQAAANVAEAAAKLHDEIKANRVPIKEAPVTVSKILNDPVKPL